MGKNGAARGKEGGVRRKEGGAWGRGGVGKGGVEARGGGLIGSCGVASRRCHPGGLLEGDQSKRLVIELWPLSPDAPLKRI